MTEPLRHIGGAALLFWQLNALEIREFAALRVNHLQTKTAAF